MEAGALRSWLEPCSDETRFQGIATVKFIDNDGGDVGQPCSDETRF